MESRLNDLYNLPELEKEQEIYLLDLSEQCAHLEEKLRLWMETLPQKQKLLLESYIVLRDELEFQSVKRVLKIKKVKEQYR